MSDEGVEQVRDVNQDEHDRDAETQSFIERAWSGRGEKAAFGVIEERWDEQADHGEDEKAGEQPSPFPF